MKKQKMVLGIGITTVDYLFNVDHFPKPDQNMRAKTFDIEGGGNVANTLVALSRLGYKTRILSRVGEDFLGNQALKLLKQENIDLSFLEVESGPTPLSIVLVDQETHTRTIIHYSEPHKSEYSFESSILDQVDLVYLDGRYNHIYEKVIYEASKRNIPIALEADRADLNIDQYFSYASIVFISRRFHQEYFAHDLYEDNLREIIKLGPKIVITTLADQGAIAIGESHLVRTQSKSITPVDTTGAGDAFNAAFLYGYLESLPLEKNLAFSVDYATASCLKIGARNGLLTLKQFQSNA